MDTMDGRAAESVPVAFSAHASCDCNTSETRPALDAAQIVATTSTAPATAPADDLPPVPTSPGPRANGRDARDRHDWRRLRADILDRLDIEAEAHSLGVR